jgi:hypothetical protein
MASKSLTVLLQVVGLRSITDRWLPFVVASVIVGIVGYGRSPPLEIVGSTINETVRPGDYLTIGHEIEWRRTWSWDCVDMRVNGGFVDSIGSLHTKASIDLGPPMYHPYPTYVWQIPFGGFSLGGAHTDSELSLSCFPFYGAWPIRIELPHLNFTVVPSPK